MSAPIGVPAGVRPCCRTPAGACELRYVAATEARCRQDFRLVEVATTDTGEWLVVGDETPQAVRHENAFAYGRGPASMAIIDIYRYDPTSTDY